MKSIMEEASSISKAVEQAWNRAGKPQEFKIKIFEEPVRNMLGFTTKPAKIAFFYEEIVEQAKKTHQPQIKRPNPLAPNHNQPVERNQERPRQQQPQAQAKQTPPHAPKPQQQQQQSRQRPMAIWEEDLVALVSTWIKSTLPLMGFGETNFTTTASQNVLHVSFSSPFTPDEGRERMLLSSFAHLIMLAVRHQAKRHIGNLKIVLKSR